MLKRISLLLLVGAVLFLMAAPAWADHSGNNMTPTAAVQDEGATPLLFTGEWGNAKADDGHYLGICYGLFGTMEIGGTYRLTEDDDFRLDPTFEFKYRYSLADEPEPCGMEGGCSGCGGCTALETALAVGAWNINFDEDKNGSIVPYVVYTHDFTGLRGSVGYSFEEDNGAFFSGWELDAGETVLRWDWMQANDGNDWDAAVGFETPFNWDDWFESNWTVGSWLQFSSDSAASDMWVLQFTYTID
jgi:hypothetical protein